MPDAKLLSKATDFIWKNARLLDRLRFQHLFLNGPKEPIIATLAGYKNADGGFGNALEPDLRGPNSQPIPVWSALVILDEIDSLTKELAQPMLSYLAAITTEAGGVPFVLPSAKDYPHAPWWETEDEYPPANLNPTAGIAGLLHKHHLKHPWLDSATDFCWRQLEARKETEPYELVCLLQFLEAAPEKQRAQEQFTRLRVLVEQQQFIELDPSAKGEVHFPLDFARSPQSLGRQLFSDEIIEQHLDALVQQQQSDGGWTVNFPIWTPITEFEWRGSHTLEVLKILRAYQKL